jgi:hypothetical protein
LNLDFYLTLFKEQLSTWKKSYKEELE